MIKDFLLNILTDPISGNLLVLDESRPVLSDGKQGAEYRIKENVPQLLPQKNAASRLAAEANGDEAFDYAAHYEEDARKFDYFADEQSFASRTERRRSREAIIERIPAEAQLVLDAGCGNAWLAKHFIAEEKHIVSMDIGSVNPATALKKYPSPYHAAVVADACHLPFKAETFDVVVASEVMEHTPDPALFIASLLKVVKRGGKLILVTPYNEQIVCYMCIHCNRPTPANAHLHSFSEKNIGLYLPKENIRAKTVAFSNKILTRIRAYSLLAFLPFRAWKIIDKAANFFLPKASVFLIEIKKNH